MSVTPRYVWVCHKCGKKLDSLELLFGLPKEVLDLSPNSKEMRTVHCICKSYPTCNVKDDEERRISGRPDAVLP